MHEPVGNANDQNSLVKKRRSSNHKRERRKLTSEQQFRLTYKPQLGFSFH